MLTDQLIVHTYRPEALRESSTVISRLNSWLQRSLDHVSYPHALAAIRAGADVNFRNSLGGTPLHRQVTRDPAMARLLLDHGADVNAADANGDTPLHRAVHANGTEAACLLLYHGADACLPNRHRWTPLTVALMMHNEQMQRALLPYETDFNRVDAFGRSLLTFAIKTNSNIVPEILKGGAVYHSREGETADEATTVAYFQRLWSCADCTGAPEPGLGIAPHARLPEVVEFVAGAGSLASVLDDMHSFRLQGSLPYCPEAGGARSRGLINMLLARFGKRKACELIYVFATCGYRPSYREAEQIFNRFGRTAVYSFVAELDLVPGRMCGHFLLPLVTMDVTRSVRRHVEDWESALGRKVKADDWLHHLYRNVTSVLQFFTNGVCVRLLDHFEECGGTVDRELAGEALARRVPALLEMCRDVVRDHICKNHELTSFAQYRRKVEVLKLGPLAKVLTFQRPVYAVDERWRGHVRAWIAAYIREQKSASD